MATATAWFEGFAPDIGATVRRFPLAIVLAALAAAAALAGINDATALPQEDWLRLFVGFASAAVAAVAGVYVVESRPGAKPLGIFALYVIPLVFIGLAQVRDFGWVAPPFLLPAVALLWLSVSPVTTVGRGQTREHQQHLFWWINQRAITTALIAAAGFVIIVVGISAIERSMFYLFGFSGGDIFYRWVLPITGLFLTPVYWLSTLPRAADFSEAQLERPDFIAIAIGFLGQFVLVPLLLIYAAILLAYTAMIAVTQSLPSGTIGWMVLGFVVTGAGAWLVLHPPFMRTRALVRVFRMSWFWLTLIPLALFFLAVWVRIDAYGLTQDRVLLIGGGLWAAILSMVFLLGRGDIRLIPAAAGVGLAVLLVGPWNYVALSNRDQGARLGALMALKADPTATVSAPKWSPEQLADARSAIFYLDGNEHGRQVLARVLLDHGFIHDPQSDSAYDLLADLGYAQTVVQNGNLNFASRDASVPIDVSATPFYVGHAEAWATEPSTAGFALSLSEGALEVYRDGVLLASQPLGAWASLQEPDRLTQPWIDFAADGMNFRLALSSAQWLAEAGAREVTGLTGQLFADSASAATAKP